MRERMKHVVIFVLVFMLALWLWPNIGHEQLHLFALRLQGIDGHIDYDFSHLPSHPSITKIGDIQSVSGGLLFVMLPSAVSIVLMAIFHILLPRVSWNHWEVGFHGFAVYLAFDLAINIMKFGGPISDFRFLTAILGGKLIATVAVTGIMLWCAWIIYVSRDVWGEMV